MSAIGEWLLASALAASQVETAPPAVPAAPAATLERVLIAAPSGEISGWLLDEESDAGWALLADDGRIVTLPKSPLPRKLETFERPVTEVPSAPLCAALAHGDERVRDRCEEVLLQQGEVALAHAGDVLDHPAAEARRRALAIVAEQAVKFSKAARALRPQVARCLGDGEDAVRHAALHAYAQLGAKDLFERCETALESDRSILVRHEAIVCFGRLGNLRAVDPLLDHLAECQEQSLRRVTFDALRRISGRNLGRDEAAWRAWWTNRREELLPADEG